MYPPHSRKNAADPLMQNRFIKDITAIVLSSMAVMLIAVFNTNLLLCIGYPLNGDIALVTCRMCNYLYITWIIMCYFVKQ